MPDRPATTDVAHERAVLERHLLRPNAEHVLPGLWWDDTWVPGIEVGDTWMPAWFAAGMPMLGIPLGFALNTSSRHSASRCLGDYSRTSAGNGTTRTKTPKRRGGTPVR